MEVGAIASRVPSRRKSLKLEAALIALLAGNGISFALQGSATKATDSAAWLVLLLLFLTETHFQATLTTTVRRFAIHAARLAAGAGVIAAAVSYIIEGNRLDAINSAVWIAVVVLLEVELRWPRLIGRARRAFTATAVMLYSTLAVLVFAWAARGEWLDTYDAALWLIAFATLEVDVVAKSAAS